MIFAGMLPGQRTVYPQADKEVMQSSDNLCCRSGRQQSHAMLSDKDRYAGRKSP